MLGRVRAERGRCLIDGGCVGRAGLTSAAEADRSSPEADSYTPDEPVSASDRLTTTSASQSKVSLCLP